MIILSLSQKPCPFSHHPPFFPSHLWSPSGSRGLLLGIMDLPLLVTTPSKTLSTGSHCVQFYSMFSKCLPGLLSRSTCQHFFTFMAKQNSVTWIHHILFVQSSVDEIWMVSTLGLLWGALLGSSFVQTDRQTCFHFSWVSPECGIARSNGKFVLNFQGTAKLFSQSSWTSLHPLQGCRTAPSSLVHTDTHYLPPILWNFIVVLISIALRTNGIEPLSMCFLVIFVSLMGKRLQVLHLFLIKFYFTRGLWGWFIDSMSKCLNRNIVPKYYLPTLGHFDFQVFYYFLYVYGCFAYT